MVQFIINLILTYVFALFFSGGLFTLFLPKGNWGKKLVTIIFPAIPLSLLFFWGIHIKENYLWWFIGIVVWNIFAQARHIKRRVNESRSF